MFSTLKSATVYISGSSILSFSRAQISLESLEIGYDQMNDTSVKIDTKDTITRLEKVLPTPGGNVL